MKLFLTNDMFFEGAIYKANVLNILNITIQYIK